MTSPGSAAAATCSAAATARPEEPPTSRPSSRASLLCHGEGVRVAYGDHLVGDLPVEGVWPDVLPHPLDQVGTAGPAGVNRALRVGADDPHRAARRFLEVAAGPRDRAAGADAGHEVREPPVGLPPDLRSRPVVVRGGIVRVGVLVGLPAVGCLPREPAGDAVIGVRMLGRHARRADDDLGTVGAQHGDLVGGDLVRAGEHAAVTALLRHDRQADPGVARGGLDDHAALAQLSLLFRGLYHAQRDPVLHRAARVEVLNLREHVGRPRRAFRH